MKNEKRLQFDLSERDVARLDALKGKVAAPSRVSVIRQAIKAQGFFINLDPDQIVEIINKDGTCIFRGPAHLLQ